MCQLFDAFVAATLNYGCEIWGFGKSKEIERVHLKFCKQLLNVKMSTCTNSIYGELGRFPMYINRYVRIIKFWCKTVSTENILISKLYDCLLEIKNNKNNWVYNVKSLLDEYGFSYVWYNPGLVDLKKFHILFKGRVTDVFKQKWERKLSTSEVSYGYIKNSFEFESYIDILTKKFRIATSRLRLSSHKLRIETGRYAPNRIDRNQRKCLLCNKNDIEDEYHFVIICPFYDELRKTFIKSYYYRHPSVYKFVELMQSRNFKIVKNLGKFLYKAFSVRASQIV